MALYSGNEKVRLNLGNSLYTINLYLDLLPNAYQQVEYIATDGNQYIDTGIKASDYQDGLEYVFEGRCTGTHGSKNNNYLFGCLASSKRSGNISWRKDNVLNVIIGATASAFYTKSVNLNTDFTLQVKATSKTLDNFVAKYNGVSLGRSGATFTGCDMPSANIYLLACNLNGSPTSSTSAPFTGKLYGFTMADMNGTEIRHFVPCYRKTDGVIGLYDTVTRMFYTNNGSGAFTKGADV